MITKERKLSDVDPGKALHTLRNKRNLTLQQVADATDISIGTLSKFENGKTGLSFRNVLRLAEGLGVPISEFMSNAAEPTATGRLSVTRADSATTIEEPQLRFENVTGRLKNVSNVFFRVMVLATSADQYEGYHVHPGEEFLYVVRGAIELHTQHYEPIHLAQGDSVHFDSGMGHLYVSVGPEPAIMLMSNTLSDEVDVTSRADMGPHTVEEHREVHEFPRLHRAIKGVDG